MVRVSQRFSVGLATTMLVAGSVGLAGVGSAQGSWPGCPPDNPSGPCRWCPGDPPVQTGNLRVNPVIWDANICHTYWYVTPGQGNVAQNIWDGEIPPPPPPPPPGISFPCLPWCI
ncbi:hypothetical protein H5U98_06990 [Mycolicibacterium boenickei]|uniref:Transglycosylase n=1 Tax=Mycolicibacterium boenickei TaxID=146017 RepID=A0AAX3A0E1_9MYCO|nr:hypothetical protein [Mycolicibacterium boenickei]UNC01132.1 hypothetical protein H5U98_06990 [Mycolicibacterium boenickei]BBX90980.1 hypothetical protein MBOE_26290 [Mycolicibacterium boenickei]